MFQGLTNGYQCTYKFESAYYDDSLMMDTSGSIHQEEVQHMWHGLFSFTPTLRFLQLGWHRAVLAFLGIAFFSGLIALCFLFCAPCVRICCIVANVFLMISGKFGRSSTAYLLLLLLINSLIKAVAMFVGIAIFFINSHKHEIRFVHGVTMTYEQSKVGHSVGLGIYLPF